MKLLLMTFWMTFTGPFRNTHSSLWLDLLDLVTQ
jgi:hypothetical protein